MISANAAVGCSVPGCCRRARLTAHFHHENGDVTIESVCCFECVTGEGHSEECDAASAALQQQQQAAAQDVGDVFIDDDDDHESTMTYSVPTTTMTTTTPDADPPTDGPHVSASIPPVEPDDGVVPEGPPPGDRARHGLSELALLVGMEHAVHGLNRLEALLMKSSRAAEGAAWKRSGGGGGASLASDSDDDDDVMPVLACESDSESEDDLDDALGRGSVSPTHQTRSVGTSHAISADMKAAVQRAIEELKSAQFIDKPDCKFQLEVAVSELVDLWVLFPLKPTDLEVSLRMAQIEFLTNALMRDSGEHEAVIKCYRDEFVRRFGNHLDAKRVSEVPGLTDEIRLVVRQVCSHGVKIEEQSPRWDLRLKMNAKLASEHGRVAIEKVVKDGRNGRIVLFSSLVEKELLADKRRLMVAKVIRVAKRFLSGAVDPSDSRWCNAQLDANTITPSEGVGPGGSVRLPTQADASRGMVTVALARPGLTAKYSKHDASEAFRLLWLAVQLCGLFATSIPRYVLGLGYGQFYCVLLALSFGSAVSPGFFDYFSKAISLAHASFVPPHPERNGVLNFINFVLVDDVVLMGVEEGLCLLWSVMVCKWAMRMLLGVFSVNETKGQEEAPWEVKKILRGVLHDASGVPADALSLRLQMTPVKREKARSLFFDVLFNWGSFEFGRWQVQVLGGNLVFYGTVCRAMWPLMMRLAQVTYLLPDGAAGYVGAPDAEVRAAYEEVWRVVELLRLIGGSPHWWDASFGGSVASTMALRERLLYSDASESLVWVGGDANMNGVASGSWSDGVYAIVKTEDWSAALLSVVSADLGGEDASEEELIVAIWEFLCFLMIATSCAANWSNKIVFYATDNQLVWRWLTNMRARSRVANFICGLITLLMARFRFECFSAYINTKKNMRDVPSRIFDADEVREGPGLDGIDEYMASTFPGMVQISVSEQLKHYLRPGGLLAAYELYGQRDPVAHSLALARSAPTTRSLRELTCIGLYSGILSFEREVTALGGCIRAIGEWSAASRAIGRLDLGDIEFFSDVLSGDHVHVDPAGVEAAFITASCVDYSSAGSQAGLNGTRGWQIVDSPRVLLHFQELLVVLVENVWGWITANEGKSFAFFQSAMRRLQLTVHPPQNINSRDLGMAIQSERAFVFCNCFPSLVSQFMLGKWFSEVALQ